MSRTRYKFKGYTITNCGYHQPDHCVWWEAVDENGEACFHGHSLREVEFMILDDEWEKKLREKDAEIERLKHWSVGNAATMREALVALRDAARNFCHQILNSKYNDIMDEYKCRERGFPALLDLRYAIPKANYALSAPARNCDRFADETDAQIAFLNEVWLISVTKETALERDRFGNWTDEMRSRYAKWLLAPVAERKGEGA